MQIRARYSLLSLLLLVLAAGLTVRAEPAAKEKTPSAPDPALERTRKTVQMLDDIYKTTVVLITDKYVDDEKDFPAGSAAIALFSAIAKKGWHEVRLLDTTGDPIGAANVAKDDFEKQALKQLKSGKSYYEQVLTKEGKRTLRAATPIPVVSKKCILCHPHYADAKPGEPVGALTYNLPIE